MVPSSGTSCQPEICQGLNLFQPLLEKRAAVQISREKTDTGKSRQMKTLVTFGEVNIEMYIFKWTEKQLHKTGSGHTKMHKQCLLNTKVSLKYKYKEN